MHELAFPLLVGLIIIALAFDFLNGLHDAANSIATVVSTRLLSPVWAVVFAAFGNFAAYWLVPLHVADTIGKGIINNSKTKIILNLEDDEAQRVQEALHLSDAETMEITHFERGHGLISTNNNNIMVEFKASPLEKDLITTDRRELREIVERKRREQSTSAEQQI